MSHAIDSVKMQILNLVIDLSFFVNYRTTIVLQIHTLAEDNIQLGFTKIRIRCSSFDHWLCFSMPNLLRYYGGTLRLPVMHVRLRLYGVLMQLKPKYYERWFYTYPKGRKKFLQNFF